MNRRELLKLAGGFAALAPASAATPAPHSSMQATQTALFRADMSRCTPSAALTRKFERNRWQQIDYETEDGVKGSFVSAYPDQECGELTLPLEADGLHKIYLGINYTKAPYPEWSPYGQLEVKLTGEAGFRRVSAEPLGSSGPNVPLKMGDGTEMYKSVQEAYWKTADLGGKSLVFRQVGEPYRNNITNLTYVKLVPLTAQERTFRENLKPRQETRRMAMIYCTGNLTGHTSGTATYHPTRESWFQDEFAPYPDSDIGIFIFEALRGNFCTFRTRIGDVGTDDNSWREEWVDPLQAFTRVAHQNGIRIFASMRMIGPQFPMNREPIARARHYWRMRQWSKRDRNGTYLTNLSLAFPGVRQYWLSLLRETLAYGTDGIHLHLNRATPFVCYEEPACTTFKEKHGVDPRTLPDRDERWLKHRAGFLTEFLREIRALLDEKPGRELGVTIYGEAHEYDREPANYHPIRYGCDVETWIREGLVNYIMPSPYVDASFLKKWREIGGERLHLWPDLMPRTQPGEKYVRLARSYRAAGADGFCLWDGERRVARISESATSLRLGHLNMLDDLERVAPSHYRRMQFRHLDGFSVEESFHDG